MAKGNFKSTLIASVIAATIVFQGCSNNASDESKSARAHSQPQTLSRQLTPTQAGAEALSLQSMQNIAKTYDTSQDEALRRLKLDIAADAMDSNRLQSLLQLDKAAYIESMLQTLRQSDPTITQSDIDAFIAQNDLEKVFDYVMGKITTSDIKKGLSLTNNPIVDGIKDLVVDALNTNTGNTVTGALFNVVLEDDGVTVFMLDQARDSETMTQIMIDALANNWDLTKKMCPMLQTNQEFGEKFAALAYERESMARFFFENIDADLYNCVADAMILSNDDAHKGRYDKAVDHSTNVYMALLMERYFEYFVPPHSDASNTSGYGSKDRFVNLLFDTKAPVTYDSSTNTFSNHGDGNELINEKFFYALFKTPTTTNGFVKAMAAVDMQTRTLLMDSIFLGQGENTLDTLQGYLNIIAISGAMYEGMNTYGFGAYIEPMIGFALLIPSDRFVPYAKAFIDAAYAYAQFNGIDVWANVSSEIQRAWDTYTTPKTTSPSLAYRSGGNGVLASDWIGDVTTLLGARIGSFDYSALLNAFLDDNASVLDELNMQTSVAFDAFIDGTDGNGTKTYATTLDTGESVYGIHGLLELAVKEDLASINQIPVSDVNFSLPPFADITMEYVYNSAVDGISSYWNNNVDAQWLADLSEASLVQEYFYSDAYALYVPSWLLAFDWLKLPANFQNTSFAQTDFNFQSGYVDIYIVSKNDNLLDDADLQAALQPIKNNVTFTKVDLGDDSIIAVDENGRDLEGLYVYKLRLVSPEDVTFLMDALAALGSDTLNAIGFDTSHASNVVAKP